MTDRVPSPRRRRPAHTLALAAALVLPAAASAQTAAPPPRPAAPEAAGVAATAAPPPRPAATPATAPLAAAQSATSLPGARATLAAAAMLAALDTRDWRAAEAAAATAGPDAPLLADIVAWHRLRAGEGRAPEFAAFLARHPDWPGLGLLRARGERTLDAAADPAAVRAFFAAEPPRTAAGGMALIAARRAAGDIDGARAEAVRMWQQMTLDASVEAALLAAFADTLAPHHAARIDRLLWAGETATVRRMLPQVDAAHRRLAEARIALQDREDGVDARIAAVPDGLAGDAGLARDRVHWRLRAGLTEAAADLIEARSASVAALGRPEAWAADRARIARELLAAGAPARALRIAEAHHLTEGADFADLEWLAGFIAFRARDDPARALSHFRTLRAGVSTPISLARAGYWEGRALEAMGEGAAARTAYGFAAGHQSAYYGLLAARRAGIALPPDLAGTAPEPARPDWRRAPFAGSSVLAAGLAIHAGGDRPLARRFLLHLAEGRPAAELPAFAALAFGLDDAKLALEIAKLAASAGLILPEAYFPDAAIVPPGLAVDRPLALAIARRESEFAIEAVSPAGARGLMQLMPGTAELMAREIGTPYDPGRLTIDPGYNARLGAGYLARLQNEFGPSLALVAAGYNAGPARPRAWIATLGDPRRASVDVVDWVESVPFAETRNYIMRVAEAVAIYRARLTGAAPDIEALLRGR